MLHPLARWKTRSKDYDAERGTSQGIYENGEQHVVAVQGITYALHPDLFRLALCSCLTVSWGLCRKEKMVMLMILLLAMHIFVSC